jgi:hypothetical protein
MEELVPGSPKFFVVILIIWLLEAAKVGESKQRKKSLAPQFAE